MGRRRKGGKDAILKSEDVFTFELPLISFLC